MQDNREESKTGGDYDISIIRPQIKAEQIARRGNGFSEQRLINIKKGLRTLHTLELMAQTIYRFQIKQEPAELNRYLIMAMCNEMSHYQDFAVKLYEYGFNPSIFRWGFWIVGFLLGYISRLKGPKAILKIGIWVETKAVRHYDKLLERIEWDSDSRKIIEKNQADEYGHIDRWNELLETADLHNK